MTIEVVAHLSDLNATYPAAGDNPQEGDDHIRNIKTALRADFPNITGPVTATQAQLNAAAAGTTGGLVLLATATASASAAIDFTTGIDGTYDEYELHIINAVPSTDGALLQLRTSSNQGVSYDGAASDYESTVQSTTNGTTTNSLAASAQLALAGTVGTSATTSVGGLSAVIRLFDPADITVRKRLLWSGATASAAGAPFLTHFTGAGTRPSTTAVNALRLIFSTGNIASGKFKLYGVKK